MSTEVPEDLDLLRKRLAEPYYQLAQRQAEEERQEMIDLLAPGLLQLAILFDAIREYEYVLAAVGESVDQLRSGKDPQYMPDVFPDLRSRLTQIYAATSKALEDLPQSVMDLNSWAAAKKSVNAELLRTAVRATDDDEYRKESK